MTPAELAALLGARGSWSWSRSSGPGGQRRDHAETRAELTLRRADLADLPDALSARLGARLGLERGPLRMTSQSDRSRERNRAIVLARLERRIAAALAPPPPARRTTRPGRRAKERRLRAKARRSEVKAARRPPPLD
jgi:ribosome-associated protein